MKNGLLKITAFLLAFVVWSAVSAPRRGRAIERAFSASVSLVGMSRSYVITTPTTVPERVSIRVRGRKADLDALTSRSLEATVDLGWIQQPGEALITLRPQAFNVPTDLEVVSIDPNKFRFRVEELRQGTVAIRPFLLGEVADGFRLGNVTLSPDRALISGPVTQVQGMSEIGTDRIILTGRTETFTQSAAVVTDSPLVRVVSPVTTRVTVPILGEFGPPPPPDGTTDENGRKAKAQ